jgi:tyrosine-protein phosphatase SIW14
MTSRRPSLADRWRRLRSSYHFVIWAHIAWLALAIGWWGFWWHHVKRFQALREGVCYRVAQPSELGLAWLVHAHGMRTILSLRLEDPQVAEGLVSVGEPGGERESTLVSALGARHAHWPMGEEACWPWVSPWQFEEFFKLFDEPDNLPVAFHCVGGRHRTGTMSALFRLEFDRWTPDRALAEMLAFDFGKPVKIQEHNLRTYLPRPQPNDAQFRALVLHFADLLPGEPPADYQTLIYRLRHNPHAPGVHERLRTILEKPLPFALPLAARLIDDLDHPVAAAASAAADACLAKDQADPADWAMAAAIVADFGSPEQQERLLKMLEGEPRDVEPSDRYQAVVAGVTNRYTPNRLPYLRPLLSDDRFRPEPYADKYRYRDTAVARFSSIVDINMLRSGGDANEVKQRIDEWFADHPEATRLTRLQPPTGRREVRTALSPGESDRDRRRD